MSLSTTCVAAAITIHSPPYRWARAGSEKRRYWLRVPQIKLPILDTVEQSLAPNSSFTPDHPFFTHRRFQPLSQIPLPPPPPPPSPSPFTRPYTEGTLTGRDPSLIWEMVRLNLWLYKSHKRHLISPVRMNLAFQAILPWMMRAWQNSLLIWATGEDI